ncbi:ubiquitin-like small modifier protein 1 [Nocardiopsis xinjiangensis]|uniref:ubiquitin-like small modifier protein 1 n=1 Tax=Nocardiopsis xinjiangensis TaxID=124285 RepID=UPI000477C61C|nr:ubiquitin-like small modifier protein 1 [Nocardiopsis xinjiangensis]
MSASVRVPTILRGYTDDAREVAARGNTLQEVFDDLEANHPGIRARILDDSGKVRRFINVYVGDEDVRFEKGLDTEISDGAQVSIIPAVAGGC